MKKRSISTIVILLVLALSAVLLSSCVQDKSRTDYCYDYKGIFTKTQQDSINQACADATKKYNVTFLVATCNRTGNSAEMSGDDVLRRLGLDDEDDYILLVINAKDWGEDYHFDIYTYGDAAHRVSDAEIEDAVWSIYADRILTGNSATAASGVVDMLPMLGKAYDGIPTWLNVVLGIAFAMAIAGVVVGLIARGYSRKRKNITYPIDKYCQMSLKDHEDTYMRSTTTVVVIRSNSGGSGGHGGGFSSGGGGGGGHRGGR